MSTDETLTDSQLQRVAAYGSSSDSKSDGDSSRTASYDDLVQNPDLFSDKLGGFLIRSGKPMKFAYVDGEKLDLHKLFVEVTTRGGLEKVIKNRKGKEVIGAFNFKKPMTNAAYFLRMNYLKMLFEFEHVFFFRQPLTSFPEREEAVKRLVEKAEHDKGTQELKIEGVIDGKFDKGYLVTVKVGSQELKGVLYQTTPPETPPRRKKKAKVCEVDSLRPKFHRSGYNFFFSEKYQGLKAEYAGKERSIIKEIGNQWKNLSPSDREVYQAKGAEDIERYKTEMAAYRSFVASVEAGSVASTSTDGAAAGPEAGAEAEAVP